MQNKIVTKVNVKVNGETVKLDVQRNLSYSNRARCARTYAHFVVKDDGTYEPWGRPVFQAFIVLMEYAGMTLPEDWGDDELMEFVQSDEYKKIWNAIDTQEFMDIVEIGEDLIEHRKQTCRKNGFIEFMDNVKGVLDAVMKTYQEAPEMAEALVGGLLERIFQNDSDNEIIGNEEMDADGTDEVDALEVGSAAEDEEVPNAGI